MFPGLKVKPNIKSIIIWLSIFAGKIACANVLSDLYAMGVTECDNMLMLLAVSTKMTEKERDVVIPLVTYFTCEMIQLVSLLTHLSESSLM